MSKIVLSGVVSSDEDLPIYRWYGMPAFSPSMLRDAIANTEPGDVLTLEVNSPGGSAMAGAEMYSILADAPCQTRAIVQSYAASAASYLILGADEVLCTICAQLMLHRPSTYTEGNVDDHLESAQMLLSTAEALLNVYEHRCAGKTSRQDLEAILAAETWIGAQRALDLGLIDGIYDPKSSQSASFDPRNVAAAFGLPDIVAMRQRYTEAHAEETPPPPDDSTKWKAQAALDIEKNRFTF